MGGNGTGGASHQRQALAVACFRKTRVALGYARGEYPVHAAVDAGIDASDRRSLGDQPRGLGEVGGLLLAHGVGDFIGNHIGRALGRGIEYQVTRCVRRLGRIEHVFLLAEIDLRLLPRHLEMIIAFLDHLPERHVQIVAMLRHVHWRHLERIGLQLERFLAAEEGFAAQRVDFRDLLIGHRVAAARRAVAMDHQLRAGTPQRLVERVRIAGVEGKIIGRLRVHLRRGDRIEAFRRLAVAFADLGPEIARPAADRIGFQERETAGAVLLPDLEFSFLLEQPDQDRRLQIHVFCRHVGDQFWRDRLVGLGVIGQRDVVAVATGHEHACAREGSRRDERANQRAVNQRLSSTPTGHFRTPNHSEHALKPLHKIVSFDPLRRNPNATSRPLPRQSWSTEFKNRVGA